MSDPVPSSAIYDATTGGLSVIVVTGGSTGDVLMLQNDGTYDPIALSQSHVSGLTAALAAKADLVGGLVPANQLPSYVDDVVEAANQAALPGTGETGKIYVTLDTGKTYRWSGSAYVELTDATAVWGQISGTLSNQTDLNSALSGKQSTLVSGTNIKTVNSTSLLGSGDITVGLSGTGSVDNAALRADGTGGATLQNSAWIIADNATASPNNTVNHACLEATGGTTNVSVSIKPKGTGSFSLAVPDGTTTGGNARGAYSVDLQRVRGAANQVASGDHAVILGGYSNRVANGYNWGTIVNGNSNTVTGASAVIVAANSCTASGVFAAIVSGNSNTASAEASFIGCGAYNTASGSYAVCVGGESCTASGTYAFVGSGAANTASGTGSWVAGGIQAVANRYGMTANAAGQFAAAGDAQSVGMQARNRTTSAVATELFLDGSSTRLTIPSGKVLSALVRVLGIKSDGSEAIKFLRDVTIKNVGGTTSLEAATVTVGTDINVSGATLDLSADNANDTLKIAVTPPTGTWRWHTIVDVANEIAYGT